MTKISVIISNLNGLPHLEKHIDALSNQKTEAKWEVIASDNGSNQPIFDFIEI